MSNILFINLKRNGDIFNTAALAQSYLKEHPHSTSYLLTYEEFSKASKPLSIFKEVFTLNRKKITTFYNNKLYSNGFALSELKDELSPLEQINWGSIVNYSNDKTSTYLSNFLASDSDTEIKGISFDSFNNVDYTSEWQILLNEVMTGKNPSPLHFSTAYHGICGIKESQGPYSIRKIKKHEATVKQNFNAIKPSEDVSLIGVQLNTSQSFKNWNAESVCLLLENLLSNPSTHPMILIAPTQEERALAKEINKNFNDKLVVIESDFLALSSVLSQLDLLVTPDTSVKHLGDLNECKVVEVSNNFNLSLKHGTRGIGNIIINAPEVTSNINLDKIIFKSTLFLLDPNEETIKDIVIPGVYITFNDQLGWNLKPIGGDYSENLLLRQLKRSFIGNWCLENFQWDVKRYFSNYNYSHVQLLIDSQKDQISRISKDLLGTLRSLAKASDSPSDTSLFITSLEKLLSHSEDDGIGSICVTEFKALLENLPPTNSQKQLKRVEDLLYRLKKNLQIGLDCLNQCEKDARGIPLNSKNKGIRTFTEVNV